MARKRVEGVSRLRRSLRRIPEALREDLRREMADAGQILENEIKARAPVYRDRLRPAATHQVSRDGLGVVAGYSKNRTGFKRLWKKGGFEALWQEFGTKQHAAQPFISPAFRAVLPGILNRIDAAVNAVLKRASNYGKGPD